MGMVICMIKLKPWCLFLTRVMLSVRAHGHDDLVSIHIKLKQAGLVVPPFVDGDDARSPRRHLVLAVVGVVDIIELPVEPFKQVSVSGSVFAHDGSVYNGISFVLNPRAVRE